MAENVFWHQGQVARADRADRNRQKSFVLWFTGLSGAGKSTIGRQLADALSF